MERSGVPATPATISGIARSVAIVDSDDALPGLCVNLMIIYDILNNLREMTGSRITEYRCRSCGSYDMTATVDYIPDGAVVEELECLDCLAKHKPHTCVARTFSSKDWSETRQQEREWLIEEARGRKHNGPSLAICHKDQAP